MSLPQDVLETSQAIIYCMITGTHILFYSDDAAADRAFIRDVLGFHTIDAGEGWLISAMPPAECGVHPTEGDFPKPNMVDGRLGVQVYLMCDNVEQTVAELTGKGVSCLPVTDEGWGLKTGITLPSGGMISLYEPRHKTAI